jgi:hypothetical protein
MTKSNPIVRGSIVLFNNGWYRVTRVTKKTVNLGAVWGGHIYHKGVAIEQVVEDEAAWYDNWRKSDSYQCM